MSRRRVRTLPWLFVTPVVLIGAYLVLLAFPEPLFGNTYQHGFFHVYSRTPLNNKIDLPLDQVEQHVRSSQLYRAQVHRVFILESSPWYTFFNGPYRQAMGRSFEFGNGIFLPQLDLERAEVVHFDGRREEMVWILAHEIMHGLMRQELGLRREWRLPFWKKEGYPEYVSSGQRIPLRDGILWLSNHERGPVPVGNGYAVPRQYFEAEIAWRYLLDVRKMRFNDVIDSPLTLTEVSSQMMSWAKDKSGKAAVPGKN